MRSLSVLLEEFEQFNCLQSKDSQITISTMLIKYFLFFLIFTKATLISTSLISINGETIMKIILESCYKNVNSPDPILIFGDSNEFILESSIIRINSSFNFSENYQHKNDDLLNLKASKIFGISDSLEDLFLELALLQETQWWNHMAPLFIIEKNKRTCKNYLKIFHRTEKMNILASIYICKIKNKILLFTSNPIANYAPHPWRRVEIHSENVFHQVFNTSISCENLHYDRTKFLNGYEIKLVGSASPVYGYIRGTDYCKELPHPHEIGFRALLTSIIELNATCRLEYEQHYTSAYNRLYNSNVDMYKDPKVPDNIQWNQHPHFFAALEKDLIGVIKSNPEISTLQKILHLWSPLVLYLAVLVLFILFSILTLNRDFSSAMLDMIRFLTYSSIENVWKNNSFRIYFTTMMIFIVTSNGVFTGKIAAFLSTLEKAEAVETLDELIELKYTIYTLPDSKWFILKFHPNAEVKEVLTEDCINIVMNSTSCACVIDRQFYEEQWALLSVETVEIPFSKNLEYYETRVNWPLLKRVSSKMMEITEAGLINFWRVEFTSTPLKKREAMRIELSLPRYRPIKLYKLDFAFHLLAAGLTLSAIAFFLEIVAFTFFNN